MVQLLGKNKDNDWVSLDLSENLVISLNKSIEEIEDITQRKGSYSKTFSIPGTVKNDQFFQSAFNVNATDFETTLQTDCIIQNYGADIFRGSLRLNKVTNSKNGTLYEIFILEQTSSLSAALERFTLCDLELSDLSHTVDSTSITDTWAYSGGSYDGYSGIVGKILYPLAHTGYDDTTGGLWDFSVSGLTNSGTPLQITQFKPWINMKLLLDRCFDKAGFTYTSDFFNSDYFESIFCSMSSSDIPGTAILGERPENQNFFRVNYDGTPYVYPPEGEYPSYDYSAYQTIVFNNKEYDYLNTYTISGFPDTGPGTGANHFTVPIDGDYRFRVKQTMYISGSYYTATYINVVLRDIDTGTVLDNTNQNILIPTGTPALYTFIFEATLTKGQRVSIQFNRVSTAGSPFNNIGFNNDDSDYELFVSPSVVVSLGEIKFDDNLMCMSGLEFFRNIVNLFNLTAISEGNNNFNIEPYPTYLSSGEDRDWTNKLNLNEPYSIEPLDYSLKQEINFTKEKGKDQLSQYYFDNFDEIFGDKIFYKESQILSGTQEVKVKFESMPCLGVGTTGTTMVVPALYKKNDGATPEEQPVSTGMKVGFYCGLVPFYTGTTDTTTTDWYLLEGLSTVGYDYYPAVNHLSQLVEDISIPFSDINFEPTYDFFKSKATTFEIYTANNIYKQFYKEYVEQLYSDDAKFFEGMFKLTPEDITDVSFNDKIYFLDSAWRLYDISDGDITEESMVKCRFIKFPYRTGAPTLVAPDYVEQQVTRPPVPTPTPTPGFCYTISARVALTESSVCDETATPGTYYSDCSTLSSGCRIYSDSGCSTAVPVARYVREVGGTDTFIVVDNDGLLATHPC